MTLKEIADQLGVSLRQVQRYVSRGKRGHKLPAVHGHVDEVELAAWMHLTGLDCHPDKTARSAVGEPAHTPAPDKLWFMPEPASFGDASTAPEPSGSSEDPHPTVFRPANPNGPLTNVPHPNSSNMPAPDTVRRHTEANARNLIESFTGVKPDDFNI